MSRLQSFPCRGLQRYPVVLGVVLSRGVSLALTFSYLSGIVASLSALYLSTIRPWTPTFSLFILSSFFYLSLSLLPTSTSNFVSPDIYRCFWSSRRFHRNATAREKQTMEKDRDSRGWKGKEGCDPRTMIEWDEEPSERSAPSFSLAEKGESSWFKFYCADNTVAVMLIRLWFIACLRDERRGKRCSGRHDEERESWSCEEILSFHVLQLAIREQNISPSFDVVIFTSLATSCINFRSFVARDPNSVKL